ncbi:hypothetical protein HBA54_22460 [Pelagibius litoralis]|uniref:Fe2OG dioxygenase domain-containing protein n=1 Tax=Pelagibius litoralis TaxID=374515 RepID=A0A967F1K7_9PROT|nr:2OG-Fe(II) oxygenase [Pelagibius litoralis]NIA71363.1 hypothetical protein [Pelagibius litoralis]
MSNDRILTSRSVPGEPGITARPIAVRFGTGEIAYSYIDDVLLTTTVDKILAYAKRNEKAFRPSKVLDGIVTETRKSISHEPFKAYGKIVIDLLHQNFETICWSLDVAQFEISKIECQMTFHRDGEYFKIHKDNRGLVTRSRCLSYVYYFHDEPKRYSGGELYLYRDDPESNKLDKTSRLEMIPKRNRIVFFRSNVYHEVAKVECPTTGLSGARGTIAGWIRTYDFNVIEAMSGLPAQRFRRSA